MDFKVDFSKYSYDDLIDARNSIDESAYPERVKELDSRIAEMMKDEVLLKHLRKKEDLEKYSTFAPRFWASLIDVVVLGIISVVLTFFGTIGGSLLYIAFEYVDAVQFVIYSVILHTLYGQTLGKMAKGVKVVDVITEGNINFKQALLRDCVPVISIIIILTAPFFVTEQTSAEQPNQWIIFLFMTLNVSIIIWHFLEILTMLLNKKRRALHDIIAGTVVVRT